MEGDGGVGCNVGQLETAKSVSFGDSETCVQTFPLNDV